MNISLLINSAISKVNELFNQLNKSFTHIFKVPVLDFSLKGKTAGKAYCGLNKIQLNLEFSNNYEEFLKETIAHEVAHIAVYQLYQDPKSKSYKNEKLNPHGYEWLIIAAILGCKTDRCHSYQVSPAKITQKFIYECKCNKHIIGLNVHKKILLGNIRFCKNCMLLSNL